MRERRQVQVFSVVAAVAVIAVACLGVAVALRREFDRSAMIEAAVLVPLIAGCRLFPLHVAHKRKMSMDSAPIFAAALLLAPWLGALCVGLSIAIAESAGHLGVRGQKRVIPAQVVFNASQGLLSTMAGSFVFLLLGSHNELGHFSHSLLFSGVVAAVALFLTNDVLLLAVVVAQVGRNVVRDWFFDRGDIPYDIALYASGFVLAVAAAFSIFMLPLLIFPVAVFQRAMRDRVLLRIQTREAVEALADVVDARDPYTFEHSKRVAEYCRGICLELKLSPDLADEIFSAARVHDVGKVGVRDAVLLKPGKLTDEEYEEMKQHPDIGARLTSRFPDFQRGTAYVRHHHEHWNGKGYPLGLRGSQIPLGARVISVADTYDAITSKRVYRDAQPDERARSEMERVAGIQLDADIVDAFFRYRGWEPRAAPIAAGTRAA